MTYLVKPALAAAAGALFALTASPGTAQDDTTPTLSQIVEAWLDSPHADRTSEAFVHWDEDGEIPGTCAVCHSRTGVIDYLSSSMSVAGRIDHPVGLGTSVDCAACHNPDAAELTSVPFPSGATVETFGTSAVCTVCHQGRASTATVAAATADLEDDIVTGDLSFINVHYAPSAASLMGGVVQGGFEYPGKTYKGQFTHVPGLDTCVSCHDPHSLEVKLDNCTSCHQGIDTFADIRMSRADFDGDGDVTQGIAGPIAALHGQLGQAIQTYAAEVSGTPIVYDIGAYPYFFVDTDADGAVTAGEAAYPNRYQSWTPRLLKAAYNYQLVAKDTAIYTHNPHYALQLLFDSLEDLGADVSGFTRP